MQWVKIAHSFLVCVKSIPLYHFKLHMHRNFDNFFIGYYERPLIAEKKAFLPFVDICFRSRKMSFQSLGNLEKKSEKKIEHFVPLLQKL